MEDGEIIARAKQGDKEAFCELVRLHQVPVRSYIAQFIRDADAVFDLAQETFLAAWRRFDTFDATQDMYPWLRGIARTLSLEHIRKSGRRKRREIKAMEDMVDVWAEQRLTDDEDMGTAYLAGLRGCLRQIQEQAGRLVEWHYFKGLSMRSIAEKLGRKEGTVRMTLLRIRGTLRECVEKHLALEEGVS